MNKLYLFFTTILSSLVFSQTILNQSESGSRTVSDPQTVILAPGFNAKWENSNPFVAKIGASSNTPTNPTDSQAGSTNPSGPIGTGSFHDTKGNSSVNEAGQFQFTLPISLPPGIKSIAPEVNLGYNSGSANGTAGYGWNISGISSISRVGKNIEKDGEMRGVQLDYSDYYSFNGQRLILKPNTGSYGSNGAEYVTEQFSNTKIKSIGIITGQIWKGPEYWEVTFADGSQAWYGSTNSGNNDARTPLEYNIVKWKDVQGNYITYNYTQDSGTNVSVISSIAWGGNETLGNVHFNEIGFNYNATTSRLIIEQSYLNGVSFIQDKLLNNIVVKTNNSQYRKYDIIYKTDDSKYQFVDKIQEYNSDNQPANPIKFIQMENPSGNSSTIFGGTSFRNPIEVSGDFLGLRNSISNIIYMDASYYPAGYYVDSNKQYYLGTENVYNGAIPITIRDTNNIVSSTQGFVSYSINSTTKDITLSYYLIDLTKPIYALPGSTVANYSNALYLVGTKVIAHNQWDESEHTSLYDNKTTIKKLIQYDVDGDGLPEVLIEKENRIRDTWCPDQVKNPDSENVLLPADCETRIYKEHKYIVIKQQDNTFPFFEFSLGESENICFGDFNGDGIDDIGTSNLTSSSIINGESVPGNTLRAYNIKNVESGNLSLFEVFSANYSGLSSDVQIGDFNGDGIADLFTRTNVNNHYVINLNTGKNFSKIPYFNHFNSNESYVGTQNGNYSVARVLDINADGKSDIINFSSSYNIASPYSASSAASVRVSENIGYLNGIIQFNPQRITTSWSSNTPFIIRELLGLKQNTLNTYCLPTNINQGIIGTYDHYSNLPVRSSIKRIEQGENIIDIEYNSDFQTYMPIKKEQYPLLELGNVNSRLVSSVSENGKIKKFRYRGLIMNLHNKKTIGFRQAASSSWFAYGPSSTLVGLKLWSGTEIDPRNEGVPVKEWSIETKDESKIFPTDISENNDQLLSFKSITYQKDKLLNSQVVTTVSDADKSKIVTVILPKINRVKDFFTGVTAESISSYNEYYLPSQTISKINTSYAVKTSDYLYDNNPSGVGANYYIGRPTSNTEVIQSYSDSKSNKEELTYENNLIKTIKNWNRDNSAYTLDTFDYDGFGNITQKVSSNSTDSQTLTSGYEYDPEGRFLIKQTDNLGLQTITTYNDWGQIKKKVDPLNNTIDNTYDKWGKLLISKTNLGGITTYQYERDAQFNSIVTQNSPDGNISKKYTNKWGQEYKNSTKAFGQDQYVSQEIRYDELGRKLGESEPYFGNAVTNFPTNLTYDVDVKVSGWNIIKYNDNAYPTKIKTISFNNKQSETYISGNTTTVRELNGYGRTTSKTADALGNIISTTDKGGTIQFTYNAAGEQTQAKYAENAVTTKYDSWGRKSEFNDPSNGVYKYEYDAFGRAKKTISPKGQKEYTYNSFGQLISQKEFSTIDGGQTTNKTISFTYNNKGLPTGKSGVIKGQTFSSTLIYDPQGRILSSSESSNGKYYIQKGITYDDKARVTSYEKQLYSSGILTKVTVENVYNTWNGELYQIKDKNSGKILWELQETNVKGQEKKIKLGAVEINNSYDNDGFLTNINHSSSIKPGILQVSYSFDAVKNELKNKTTGGDFNILETFTYDDNNRLKEWSNPVTGQISKNTYDIKGRILENDQVGTIKFSKTTKIYQPTGLVLNDAGQQNYLNNLLQKITYNENNDPVFLDGLNGDVAFEYGLNSMRQKVTYGGNFNSNQEGKFTKFYSEAGSFEVLRDNVTGKEKHVLYIGGTPYESNIVYLKDFTENNGSYKFLHKDYLGSILAISDEAGNRLEWRHFDAWGNLTHLKIGNGSIITDQNVIRNSLLLIDRAYTSHEHFAEVGIIHMNGRLYDPLLRRFLNADENIQDPTNTQNYNKYGYVMNNPLMYNDPSGEFWGWFIGALVGSYFSGVQANNGNFNPVKWDWKNTWTSVVAGGIAGGAIGGGIQNISTKGAQIFQNSVVGAVGSIFNGLSTGQSIFKSALVGLSGINYSFNLSGNNKRSTDIIDYPYGGYPTSSEDYSFASYSDDSGAGGYSMLTKSAFASFFPGASESQVTESFENLVLGICVSNGLGLLPVPSGSGLGRVPDGFTLTSGIDIKTTIPGGVKTRAQFLKPTIIEATATYKSNVNRKGGGQLYDYIDWLSKDNGNLFLFTTSNVTDIRNLIRYGDQRDVNVFHMVPMYKLNSNNISINFIQRKYILSLFGDYTSDGNTFLFNNSYHIPR